MYRRGRTHAKEARTKGVNVLLGPAMGPMGRMPAGGRNWEGFGADPVLQAIAAAETIKGIQDEGVQATAKHLVGQEQEHYRQQFAWGIPHAISSNIDDRTLHEVYAWPFAESIRAGVASVMCSYNQVNNSYACGNSKLMNGLIKDELGFQGYVQSDWLAKRSGIASALAGLDMDMPGDGKYWLDGNSLWGEKITVGALNESLPMERLNDMVTRIVAAWYQLGQDDKKTWPPPPPEGDGGPNFSSWTDDRIGKLHHFSGENITGVVNKFIDAQGVGEDFHGRLVKEIAVEATILLKNEDNVLPLNRKGAEGLPTDQTYNVGIFGEDAGPGQGPNFCEDRGCNQGTLASGWGSGKANGIFFALRGSGTNKLLGAVEFPYLVTPYQALESEFDRKYVNITEHLSNSIPTKSTIAGQDLCLVFVNSDSGEGYIKWKDVAGDRPDISIQKDGDKLVRAVAKDCGNDKGSTIVIVHSVGPAILEPWIDIPNVKGVIWANLPGQESGNALASILFGDADPSGRLPYTIAKSLDDYGPGGQIQYYPNGVIPQQDFKEGLFIDYRHFDKYSIKPRYEFGFGLSYTTFSYSDIRLATLKRKSPLPDSRPPPSLSPPTYDSTLPDAATALFPAGMHRVHNRIYPYISSVSNVKKGSYPYPDGYNNTQTPSPAGGGLGGNPSLFEDHVSVSFTVTNTGSRAGKDVAQIYVSFPDNVQNEGGELVEFPVKVLRQFEKVALEPGESKEVEVRLNRKDLSFWDVWRQNWVMPVEGEIEVLVGRSVRDIVLKGAW